MCSSDLQTKDPAIEQIQKLYDAPPAPTPQTSAPVQPESITRQALKVFAVLAILCGAIILLGTWLVLRRG